MAELINIGEIGLDGSNYYWEHRDDFGISKELLLDAGVDGSVYVHIELAYPLRKLKKQLLNRCGWSIFIKSAYRPEAIYEAAYQAYKEKHGEEAADAIYNMKDMPHATGKAVDVVPIDRESGEEVFLRNGDHGDDAKMIGFYHDHPCENAEKYSRRQKVLHTAVKEAGFLPGKRGEYFHFNYDLPEISTSWEEYYNGRL